jgi:hypothetical protein
MCPRPTKVEYREYAPSLIPLQYRTWPWGVKRWLIEQRSASDEKLHLAASEMTTSDTNCEVADKDMKEEDK